MSPVWTARHVILGTLVVVAVALGFWLLYQLRFAAFSLFEAIVISTAITPAVDWLYSRKIPRAGGVILIYLGLLALVIGFVLLVFPLVVEQGATRVASLTSYYQNFLSRLQGSSSLLIQHLAQQLPHNLLTTPVPGGAGDQATLGAVTQALVYLELIGNGTFTFIAVLLLTFYWTLERERTLRSLLLFAPLERREDLRELIVATEEKVGGYLRGIAALSLIVGAMALLAYLLIGLRSALLLALIAGLMEAIPLIGPMLGAVPAVLVALSSDPSQAIWVVVATIMIQFVENTFLVPRVMGRAVGVNPVLTLLALAAFGAIFGLPGAFLAIPLAAIIQMLLDRFVLGLKGLEQQIPEGRDYVSVLRVEAQELVRDVRKQVREKSVDLSEVSDHVEDSIEAIANDLDSILAGVSQKVENVP